jgi:Flp pilus assembly protein TadD
VDLVRVLNAQHKHGDALRMLEEISEPEARSATARQYSSEALIGLGRPADAGEILGPAILAHPDKAELHYLQGVVHLANSATKEAVASLERSIALDPHEYRPRYQLAIALEQLNRTADAAIQRKAADDIKDKLQKLSELNRAAMKDPWDADVRWKLAEACEKLNKRSLAEMWRKAAAACPPKR